MKASPFPFLFAAVIASSPLSLKGAISGVTEVGLAGDTPAIIETGFGEDALTFSDRTHQHNGAAFNAGTLSTTGADIVPLPTYLVGNDFVRFANNARDQAGYSATVTTDVPSNFYLLLDNRINGPGGAANSPNSTDPDLGGTFQWVIDGGWVRVNTGISPDGQADYTGVDEGGESVGAGIGLNQFYSVWTLPTIESSVTISNNGVGGSNMVSLVAAPAINPGDPISSFAAAPPTISFGDIANLNWLIATEATVGTIDGNDILPDTTDGAGTLIVSPTVTTTYSLSVESPGGNETADVTVTVRLLDSFTADSSFVDPGTAVILDWSVRPDASVSISGIGNVDAQTTDGFGSIVVNPTSSTTYTITATAGAETPESADVTVGVRPAGTTYVIIDIGATSGQVEPGAVGQFGAPLNANGVNPFPENFVSATGDTFGISIDNIDPLGVAVGGLDWRDRGDGPGDPQTLLVEDLVKNNLGVIRVTLSSIPAGDYAVLSYHLDPTLSQSEQIDILVTDANGTAVDTGVDGDASYPGHPANTGAPAVADLTTSIATDKIRVFSATSNGVDDLIFYFDGRNAPIDDETPLNALWLIETGSAAPSLVLTTVERTGANTFELSWSGGDGTNDIQASVNGVNWTTMAPGVASPQTIAADPVATPFQLFRVIEP